MLSPRARLYPLSQLCHRLALSSKAGIEDRKTWSDEARRSSGAMQRAVGSIADDVAAGSGIGDALPRTGEFFPPLFRRMVEMGEATGRLDVTYRRLAEHYDRTRAAKRDFLSRIAWPMMQLGVAAFVIGLLIYIMGFLEVDILGFGLTGTRGLVIYLNLVIALAIGVFVVLESVRRRAVWVRPLQRLATRAPVVGDAIRTLALARFAWALQLVLDTPMDLRVALPLALDASGNEFLSKHGPAVAERIQRGMSLPVSLAKTGAIPGDLLDAIAAGDEAGSLVEAMKYQSREYQRRAADAMSMLAQLAGYTVWVGVAALIIVMIFRIFSFYTDTLNSLM